MATDREEARKIFRKIVGDLPYARVTSREASSPAEYAKWKSEGVFINQSIESVLAELERRRLAAEAKNPPEPTKSPPKDPPTKAPPPKGYRA
jgi:hypothetical protein